MTTDRAWLTNNYEITTMDVTNDPLFSKPTLMVERNFDDYNTDSLYLSVRDATKLKKVLEAFINTYST